MVNMSSTVDILSFVSSSSSTKLTEFSSPFRVMNLDLVPVVHEGWPHVTAMGKRYDQVGVSRHVLHKPMISEDRIVAIIVCAGSGQSRTGGTGALLEILEAKQISSFPVIA